MSDIDVAYVLERAADDIATNGLAKGRLLNDLGQHCAIGAIGCAVGLQFDNWGAFLDDDGYAHSTVHAAAERLVPYINCGGPPMHDRWVGAWDCVVTWNNARERTADEVVEAMRHAAKDLRNEATS